MFALSIFLGIYSYGIFALGLAGILSALNVFGLTISLFLIFIYYFWRHFLGFRLIRSIRNLSKLDALILAIVVSQLLVNLIGALGPELGFDALWYHLSLPKIWLSEQLIRFIPGNVGKYSVMPKLLETLYVPALVFGSEITAKLIHFSFGVLTLWPLYQLSRKFLNRTFSLLVILLFYTNLVVGWMSITAYVDLARTFFELLALKLLYENKIVSSGITLGLAISVKLIALGCLPVFWVLILLANKSFRSCLLFSIYCLLIPLPWFIFSFTNTGNPFYPIFSEPYLTSLFSFNPSDLWVLFTHNSDPISPLYIITAPLIFLRGYRKWGRGVSFLIIYCLLSLLVWFITPRTGGGRFILPYLPAFSILAVYFISEINNKHLKLLLLLLTITTSVFSVFYRLTANVRFLPVILGKESKSQFLSSHLNYTYGDYYDTDNFLTQTLSPGDNLLVAGINNVFYLPSFLHFRQVSEYSSSEISLHINEFNFLLVRYPDSKFFPPKNWRLVHTNSQNHTFVYQKY